MAEKEIYERSVAQLCGEIDALHGIIIAIASEMPERATYHIAQHAEWWRQQVDADAKSRPNDLRRDYADSYWKTCKSIHDALDEKRTELEDGAIVRTIQPAPIPSEEQLFPKKGW